MRQDTIPASTRATSSIAEIFYEILTSRFDLDLEEFEDVALEAGHKIMASAFGLALEALDARLCAEMPDGWRVHDRRTRRLLTKMGDVSYTYRRTRDRHGRSGLPLAEHLDMPHYDRITPAARAFLVEAGAEVSYEKAGRLLEKAKGSIVSANAVMTSLRETGALCAEEDAEAAASLYRDGVIPEAEASSTQISLENDGTWIRLQGVEPGEPERVEVKALVAYEGKEVQGGKVVRKNAIRHACVGSPEAFWTQGIATVGTKFDLSSLRAVHVGQDGEKWCGRAEEFMPGRISVTGHLDPFHVNRAVVRAVSDKGFANRIIGIIMDGDKDAAICLLEASREMGLASSKHADRLIAYLKNNIDLIGVEGPSLGTMDSENQHVYGARMDSVPCAWSRVGASDMARIRSRLCSGRKLPHMTREKSASPKRSIREQHAELRILEKAGLPASKVVESVGNGYLPPQASLVGFSSDVRYRAGLSSAMLQI